MGNAQNADDVTACFERSTDSHICVNKIKRLCKFLNHPRTKDGLFDCAVSMRASQVERSQARINKLI